MRANELRKSTEKELISRWSEVVGEAISNEVELVDVDAGTLLLRTSNPSWKTEIIFQKRTILAKANAVLSTGKFRDIRFI